MSLLKVGVGQQSVVSRIHRFRGYSNSRQKAANLNQQAAIFCQKAANKDYRYRYRYSAILVNRYGQILAIGELVTSIGSDKTVNGATDLFLMPRALDKQRRRPWFCRSLLLMFSDANYAAH